MSPLPLGPRHRLRDRRSQDPSRRAVRRQVGDPDRPHRPLRGGRRAQVQGTLDGRGHAPDRKVGARDTALGIDRSLDGRPATRRGGLWFEASGIRVPPRLVERTPRIGVGYAGAWAEKPLRFVVDPRDLPTILPSGRPKP
ncbi:MAG: hypothetical protein FJ286_15255 [Planctomycetes bacterium]|nr:hypothetical protein [Planctomycetota bacterium]